MTVSVVNVPLIPLDTEENETLDGFDTDKGTGVCVCVLVHVYYKL